MYSKTGARDLILTKTVPSVRAGRQVARAELLQRLKEALQRRLTLVHAPAGYGKTSLLSQWHRSLLEEGIAAAWLTLEEEEAEPSRLAEYVLVALGRMAVGRTDSDASASADEPRPGDIPLRSALSALVNRLSRTAGEVVLILDDFHRAESEGVCAFLRSLIRLAPASFHLVIASRDYPRLGQAALAADAELLDFGVRDLRFTPAEAEAVLNPEGAATLTREDVMRLVERTEGWPIALQMSAVSLRRGDDHKELIANFAGPSWELAQYLSEQVLASLPEDVREIVTRIAIADRLTGELVNLLCERQDGWLVLERMEQQNLFLVPLDPGRRCYRFHQMFADFLRARLARRDAALLQRLHRAAAGWFAANDRIAEAVHHAALAADENLVAEILDEAGGWRLIPEGLLETVVAGMAQLSEDTVARFPRLMLARVYLSIKRGDMAGARSRYDAFVKRGALPVDVRTEVMFVGDVLADYEDAPVTLDDLLAKEALIRSLPSEDHLVLANTYELLGANYCACGWLERALEPTLQARAHYDALGSLYSEIFTHFLEARIKLAQGRLGEAQAVLDGISPKIDAAFGPRSDLAANRDAYQAEICFERDHGAEAQALLDWALPHMEQSDGWSDVYACAFLTAAHAAAGKSVSDARDILARMRRLARQRHLRQLELLANVSEVELLLSADMNDAARALAQDIDLETLAADMREETPPYRQVAILAALCKIKLDLLGDHSRAGRTELERMQTWARQHGQGRLLIPLCILSAYAHRISGERDVAAARFDEAVSMAMFQGFIRPFFDCARFVELPPESQPGAPPARQPDRFREQFLRQVRKALGRRAPQRPDSALNAAESITLCHLNRGYTNKEIARLLKISPNTVKYRLRSLYAKLAVNTRKDAVRVSRERRLVDSG